MCGEFKIRPRGGVSQSRVRASGCELGRTEGLRAGCAEGRLEAGVSSAAVYGDQWLPALAEPLVLVRLSCESCEL